MAGELFDFFLFLIVVCILAGLILFAVRRFFAELYEPARYIVGGLALDRHPDQTAPHHRGADVLMSLPMPDPLLAPEAQQPFESYEDWLNRTGEPASEPGVFDAIVTRGADPVWEE